MSMLEIMFEVNRQRIDELNAYREGGGLERIVETSARFQKLQQEQLRLLELFLMQDE